MAYCRVETAHLKYLYLYKKAAAHQTPAKLTTYSIQVCCTLSALPLSGMLFFEQSVECNDRNCYRRQNGSHFMFDLHILPSGMDLYDLLQSATA